MEFVVVAFAVLFLLIVAGFAISLWLYRGSLGTGPLRRIRRVRAFPDGPVIEEIIEEEVPVEDQG